VEGDGAAARLEWEPDPVPGMDADALLGQGRDQDSEEGPRADTFLRRFLADGRRPTTEILAAGRANGISERTLCRAKLRQGIEALHEGQPGKQGGVWYWALPDADEHSNTATSQEVAPFGQEQKKAAETKHSSPKGATPDGVATFGPQEDGEVDVWSEQ